ncbi:MAG: hypothetical protein ABI655_09985 [Phenylobacterium sp.]
MRLKALLAAIACAAVAMGFALPAPHSGDNMTRSQIETISLGRG